MGHMLLTLEQIVIAGIHLGHPVRRWNPKMAPYIYGVKNGSHLIDLVRTRNQLNEAHFLTIIAREGKCALFVRDKTHGGRIAIDGAFSSQSFFVRGRWLGGTLTNWSTIQISLLQLHSFIRSKKKMCLDRFEKKKYYFFAKTDNTSKSTFGWIEGDTFDSWSCYFFQTKSKSNCYSRIP